jgi:hypothetical protein
MKSYHNKWFHFWGSEYKKKYFQKWYDNYTGINLFGRELLGFWVRDSHFVVDFKSRPFKTKRDLKLILYIVHWVFNINLLNINKSKYSGSIKKKNNFPDSKVHWYEGYIGLIILGVKFLGFSISDKIYDDGRSSWIFVYIFGFTFSIDIIGRLE